MWTMAQPEITPHTFIGVSLAVLGVVLTLDNLGFVEAQAIFRFWPLVLVLFGSVYVVQGRDTRAWVLGACWMAVGTAFLLRNLDVFRFRLTDFLPLVLVAVGLKFMFGRRQRRDRHWPGMPDPAQPPPPPGVPPPFGPMSDSVFGPRFDPGSMSGEAPPASVGGAAAGHGYGAGHAHAQVLRVFAMMFGADRRHVGALAHVEVSAVMGGCDIDLRDAVPSAQPLVIQVFAMWGGIDIRVPPGWLVQNEAWPILGGILDSTTRPAIPTHRVLLRGNAFMGGVEVKN
jgi:predicted membrane protein